MVSFKKQCITFRKRGYSLNQIVGKTKRAKSSIYFHIRQIPLSKRRKREIKLAAIKRFNEYSRGIKGQSRLDRHPTVFTLWNKNRVSLISHLLFDGEITRSGCVYTNRNKVLHIQFTVSMKEVYPFSPKKYESLPGVFKTGYYNVELAEYLKLKAKELIANIQCMETKFQRVFLRSFFDDEGSIYFIGKRRAVRGYQHSYEMLLLVRKLLNNFYIKSKVDKKYNEIIISRKENIEKFAKEVNFTPGVRVNGKRSNSVWKKSLEKRNILKKSLASYQN